MKVGIQSLIIALLLAPGAAHSAAITFGPATQIAGDTDVYTGGTLEYAYAWSNISSTVNGVPFTGTSFIGGDGSGDVTWGFDQNNTTAYGNSGAAPFSSLSTEYKDILRGGSYNEFASAPITVTLNNLNPGTVYAVQFWYHDDRACCSGAMQTVTSFGGNSVILDKGTGSDGGLGDYTIGFFTADAVSQAFTVSSATANATQINALQVRAIPEPSSLALLAFGAISMFLFRRNRK